MEMASPRRFDLVKGGGKEGQSLRLNARWLHDRAVLRDASLFTAEMAHASTSIVAKTA
jgi:hypothetical protein